MKNLIFTAVYIQLCYSMTCLVKGALVQSGSFAAIRTIPYSPGCFLGIYNMAYAKPGIRVIVSISQSNDQQPINRQEPLWVDDVNSFWFTVCTRESIVKSKETLIINWIGIQGTIDGLEQGTAVFNEFGSGTQCKTIQMKRFFPRPFRVQVTLVSHGSQDDAMDLWVIKNDFGGGEFAICIKERFTFSGIHRNLKVNWIAYEDISNPLNLTESKKVLLADSSGPDSTYCKNINFDKKFYRRPAVLVTGSYHSNDFRPVTQMCKAMATWTEDITKSSFKLCARQLQGPQNQTDAISIDYIVNGDIDECLLNSDSCDPNAACINLPGSYKCKCKLGYYGNGTVCYKGNMGNSVILHDYGNSSYYIDLHRFLRPVLQDSRKSHWVRCWRAATDGWDVNTKFHRQCDNKGPTVSLVRVGYYIFGGYSDVSWDTSNSWTYSNKSFLFSLYNTRGYYPIKLPIVGDPHNAIYRGLYCGPGFGKGRDMYVTHLSPTTDSFFFVYTYKPPPGCKLKEYCWFYTGNYRFRATDVEVFYESTK